MLNLGLSVVAKTIELEEFALNTAAPTQSHIMKNGPAAYRTKLPLDELSTVLNKQGCQQQFRITQVRFYVILSITIRFIICNKKMVMQFLSTCHLVRN